jgi:Na+-transporting methylmalonyl-CoA/oxaloacetate decarboxylase beta subunit
MAFIEALRTNKEKTMNRYQSLFVSNKEDRKNEKVAFPIVVFTLYGWLWD